MHDNPLRGWQSWRVRLAGLPALGSAPDRFPRSRLIASHHEVTSVDTIPTALKTEAPGPDGIRHGLVAFVRAAIADGTYDTEERWLMAEEKLLSGVMNDER